MEHMRTLLRRAFDVAVAAADPAAAVEPHLPEPPERGRLLVAALGKAAGPMAAAVERHYRPTGAALHGLVVTARGHGVELERLPCIEAGHPVPDEESLRAGEALLALADGAGPDDLLLVLLSGGGSALACAPARGLDLAGKQAVTAELLRSGADITEMNLVRKHLSALKGGRLAARAAPARVLTLVISDVVGDDLASVASGPTVPDGSAPQHALAVLDGFGLPARAARAVLERAAAGGEGAPPARDDPALARCEARLIGSNQVSLEAARAPLEAAGYRTLVLSNAVTGEAREAGAFHAAIALQVYRHAQPAPPPLALLSGGETTVSVRGDGGRGGRNSEFALGLALALPADAPVAALAADSDGIDGIGGHAGAFVTPELLRALAPVAERARARAALARNDSYSVFEQADHLLVSGPTRTNVNDLRVVLVGDPPPGMR